MSIVLGIFITLLVSAVLWKVLQKKPKILPRPLEEAETKVFTPEPIPQRLSEELTAVLPEEPLKATEEKLPEVADVALQRGLAKTQASFLGRIQALLGRNPKVDAAVLDELEEVLLSADVGVRFTTKLLDDLREQVKTRAVETPEHVQTALKARLEQTLLSANPKNLNGFSTFSQTENKPKVVMFVGVNGVGKTTTIGKIAVELNKQGKHVVLAAGDTFRAAAKEQLGIWGERSSTKVIGGEENADPASVVFNAVTHAKEVGADVVLADTAGRLHTKTELMDEIKKIKRVLGKARAGAPDEIWLVVDATTGQNALQQAKEFHEALGLTGIVLTKLDGTAKGGVIIAIAEALQIPVRFVGVGEKSEDLRPFAPQGFVRALFEAH